MGHKSDDPCVHKKHKQAGVMTFVAHCTVLPQQHITWFIYDSYLVPSANWKCFFFKLIVTTVHFVQGTYLSRLTNLVSCDLLEVQIAMLNFAPMSYVAHAQSGSIFSRSNSVRVLVSQSFISKHSVEP